MPVVLVTPEALVGQPGPHVTMLEESGFDVRFPDDKTFTRGLCGEDETIRVIHGAEALMAGGEFLTARVIGALPDLRVIARFGVGYDRVDVAAATSHGVVNDQLRTGWKWRQEPTGAIPRNAPI